jgi:uncharacterized protein (TIGR03435 family)
LVIITERSRYEVITTNRGTQEIDAARITLLELASILSPTVDRLVVDGTKLTGLYQLRIEIPLPSGMTLDIAKRRSDGAQTDDPTGVSAFQAVERLGLRLEPRRIQLDTIVVDRIEKAPTDN